LIELREMDMSSQSLSGRKLCICLAETPEQSRVDAESQ